jgi:predicted nuclease of predicted toxin-antitoxin system
MTDEAEFQWHEFVPGPGDVLPPGPHKRAKFYADACVPREVVEELRGADLDLMWAVEDGLRRHPDGNIYGRVRKLNRVLVTMDRDFWDDREYPLHGGPGVIFVDHPPDQPARAIEALAISYALFIKHFPGDWWRGTKVRVTDRGFSVKGRTGDGKVSEDEFRLGEGNKLLRRCLR